MLCSSEMPSTLCLIIISTFNFVFARTTLKNWQVLQIFTWNKQTGIFISHRNAKAAEENHDASKDRSFEKNK